MAYKDPEKRREYNRNFMRARYAAMPESKREEIRKQQRISKQKWFENLTPEEIEARNKKERERYANDPEHKRKANSRALFNRLGISLEQKEELFESQDQKCASCGSVDPGSKRGWHADHDYDTNFIRGILCAQCNMLLGFLEKQPERIARLNAYLNFKPDYSFEVL